jgi:CTP synthase
MENKTIKCGKLKISNSSPFVVISGPCQLENEKHALDVATKLKEITQKLNIKKATSSEFASGGIPIIGLINEWNKDGKIIKGTDKNLGGTMRLGLYEAKLKTNSLIHSIYKSKSIKERHRHRYEVNIRYKDIFEKNGMIFSGLSPDNKLPEIIELKNHPWFLGVQFHPEFKSRPLSPHPLFSSFVKAAKNHK